MKRFYTFTASAALLFCMAINVAAQDSVDRNAVRLFPGIVIDSSVVIEPDRYYIAADSVGAVFISGDNIVVDFQGAELIGSLPPANDQPEYGEQPDLFAGTGIRVQGRNIVIRNVIVRGYKIALWATNSPGLRLSRSDFSYNYRQRLKSTLEREHIDDWMSYHQNENNEWMRYGAAVYIRDSDEIQIDSLVVTGGQNGIMLTNVNKSVIVANSITFNSGVGLGLYRSSGNQIQLNQLDWNVRGYSHGVYFRGQDSAALLLFEQSSDNVIAYNSATHSGDGLFLWGGQSTMDTGEGGCNDNLIYGNDFSYAPTNGIEVTFSRNVILRNKIHGCWHGIWGGYSNNTAILGNDFADNTEHIAIEHGQRINIEDNTFVGGDVGVKMWQRATQPDDWGYPKNRSVASEKYAISGNTFESVSIPIDASATTRLSIRGNVFSGDMKALRISDSSVAIINYNAFASLKSESELKIEGDGAVTTENRFGTRRAKHVAGDPSRYAPARIAPLEKPSIPENLPIGRQSMRVDQWGPYDYRSPVLWPATVSGASPQRFVTLGPKGEWSVIESEGIDSVSTQRGLIGDTIVVWQSTGSTVDMKLVLEFVGDSVVDRFGNQTPAGVALQFDYSYFFTPIDWTVDFFEYDELSDPRTHYEAFQSIIRGKPVYSDRANVLAYQWYGSPHDSVRSDHFATASTGVFEVPDGEYFLDLTSDDGVRVWVDGKVVHDDWTYHAPKQESIPLSLGGRHFIRIEHFEIDGYATLLADIRRRQ